MCNLWPILDSMVEKCIYPLYVNKTTKMYVTTIPKGGGEEEMWGI